MTVDILIATCVKDMAYLEYCVRSIHKFCNGFNKLVLVVGADEESHFRKFSEGAVIKTYQRPAEPIKYQIAAQAQKCMADIYCEADFILHMDSDCVFTEPVKPEDYFLFLLMYPVIPTPIMLYEHYSNLPGNPWKAPTERALGFPVDKELMRRHPQVNPRGVYPAMRSHIEKVHHMAFEQYVLSCKADFPWGFSEHNCIGAFAIASREFNTKYHWWDVSQIPRPKDKLAQFWSHSPPHLPQGLPSGGNGVPMELFQELGL